MSFKTERRSVPGDFEVRSEGNTFTVEGHAAVFNRYSQNLGGFVERVAPGTFSKTIQEADIRALFNHNPLYVLGRNKSGTLELAEDESGLYYRVKDLPTSGMIHDLVVAPMLRGDISQSSFGFRMIQDDWGFTDGDFPLRTLKEVQLLDVSPVTYPAYLDADSSITGDRALESLAEARGVDLSVVKTDIKAVIRGSEPESVEEPVHTTPSLASLRAMQRFREIAATRR